MAFLQHSAALLVPALMGYAGLALLKGKTGDRKRGPAAAPVVSKEGRNGTAAVGETGVNRKEFPLGSGEALRHRLGLALEKAGLDPGWASDLAAGEASGFPELFQKLKTLPADRQAMMQEFLFDRWVEVDPLHGAQFFKAQSDPKHLPKHLEAFFRHWSRIDFVTAATHAAGMGDSWYSLTLVEKARVDPSGFLAWIRQQPDPNPMSVFKAAQGYAQSAALKRLAEVDSGLVRQWAAAVPEDQWPAGFANQLASRLALGNPDTALAWARSLRQPAQLQAAMAGVAAVLAKTQPDRALALITENGPVGNAEENPSYIELFRQLAPGRPAAALEAARLLNRGPVRDTIVANLLGDLLRNDPGAAFRLADSIGMEANPETTYGAGPEPGDAAQARAVLDAAGEGEVTLFRQRQASLAFAALLHHDPAGAGIYLQTRMNQPFFAGMKNGWQDSILQTGARPDPGVAAALGIGPEHWIAFQARVVDPAAATAALHEVTDPVVRQESAGQITMEWVKGDRADAIEWAATLAPMEQSAAWKAITAHWLKEDSNQASAWVAALPPGPPRDEAVILLTRHVRDSNPGLAWQWALSLTDPAMQIQALAETAVVWQGSDRKALENALGDPALKPQQRQAVVRSLDTAGSQ